MRTPLLNTLYVLTLMVKWMSRIALGRSFLITYGVLQNILYISSILFKRQKPKYLTGKFI